MRHYLIFGNGFMGNRFDNFLQESVIADGRINTIDDISLQIKEHNPKIVINTVGKTGRPNIDWCETHREETFFSNVTVPSLMAEACADTETYMVHIGSGCVYETNRCSGIGFSENDKPNFKGSFYSRTKIFAENILSEYDNILQLRIRMPIDNIPSPRNLIDKLLSYRKVISIPNSVTTVDTLLETTKKLMDRKETGIFNVTNRGVVTHKEILEMYKELVDPDFVIPEFISIEELKNLTIAERSNCVLYNKRLEKKGIETREVHEAIKDCLIKYKIHKDKMK